MRAAIYDRLAKALNADELVAQATVVDGPGSGGALLIWPDGESAGELGGSSLEDAAEAIARELFPVFGSRRQTVETDDTAVDLFVRVHAPRPQLIVVGGGHVSEHLVRLAAELDYTTVVIDPRTAFATPDRFVTADRLIQAWPQEALQEVTLHEATAVAILSHDLKLDLPALEAALASPAGYVGALGSRKTQARRVAALQEAGVDPEAIDRIHSPIGLDLGGREPREIALAIVAEIVAVRHGEAP